MDRIPAFLQDDANVYFAAANTANGFHSHFSKIFNARTLDRIVILKGGPGTGKSTLMIRLWLLAKERGYSRDTYLCSSDTGSLDAVFLPELKLAVVDGTSPHTLEPICPGAVETLFDCGAFWDVSRLKRDRELFFDLIAQKNEAYRSAYRFLKSAGAFFSEEREKRALGIDTEKMASAAERLFQKTVGRGKGFTKTLRQISAFSGGGLIRLPSLERRSDTHVSIRYASGTGSLFLSQILRLAQSAQAPVEISFSLLRPGEPEAVYFPVERVLFSLTDAQDETADQVVNMDRFLSKNVCREHRNQLRLYRKLGEDCAAQAANCFARAAAVHASLESRYVAAMDFHALADAWEKQLETLL